MTTHEGRRAANTPAVAEQTSGSPRGSAADATALTCPEAIAAADRAAEKRLLVGLIERLTYRGRTSIGSLHHFVDDWKGAPVYATRRSVRALVGPDVSSLVVERLAAELVAYADDLESVLIDRAIAFSADRACDLTDDADDDDLRAYVAEQRLGIDVLAATRRHPSARRFCRTGGVR